MFRGVFQLLAAAFFLIVGTRLLLLSRRTGEAPEKLLGCYFVATGPAYVGWVMPMIYPLDALTDPVDLASWALYDIGVIPLVLFARVVFRPNAAWANWLAGSCTLLLFAAMTVWIIQAHGYYTIESPWFWCQWLGYTIPCLWVSIEAFLCYVRANRRLRIGLCDSVVANRYLLFGLFGAFQTFACITDVVLVVDYALIETLSGEIAALLGVLEMAGILTLFLVFSPPAMYRRWIAGNHVYEAAAGVG